MEATNTENISIRFPSMATEPMGAVTRPLAYYREDTDLELDKIFTEPIRAIERIPSQSQYGATNQGSFDWSDLARLNALISHSTCKLFAQNGNIWQRIEMVHQGVMLLRASLEQPLGPAKMVEVTPRITLYLGDANVETCARLNALLKYSKQVHMFADLDVIGNIRIQAIRPCGPQWIELVVMEQDDSVHLLRRYYEPLLLTL